MIPQQRKMVERLAGQPFTLLGINSDGDRSGLPTRLEDNGIGWPQIYEGSNRQISQRWNVQAYPTIYILDHEGIIRRKGFLMEPEVERIVQDLLDAIVRLKARTR